MYGVSNGAKMISSAINMLANKAVDPSPLISKEIAFADVADALKKEIEHPHRYIKVLVKM